MSAVLSSSDLTNDSALEKTANKNAANGYAGLDAGGKLALAQTPLTTEGDLLFANSTPAVARLARGSNGQCLTATASSIAWASCAGIGGGDNVTVNGTAATDANLSDTTPAAAAGTSNVIWQKDSGNPDNISAALDWGKVMEARRRKPAYYTDLLGPSGAATLEAHIPWDVSLISSGTQAKIAGVANHPGVLRFSSSTSANSGGIIAMDNTAFLLAGGEVAEFIFQHKVASGTNTTIRMGFLDTTTSADVTDGAYIEIASGSLNATCKTANNGTRTTSSTIATLSIDTWYRAQIRVNADATSVTCEIFNDSGTSLGSQANSANIPTATGRETGMGLIYTNAGTSAVLGVWIDWIAVWYDIRALAR
jgi:hypothetical protein